MASSCEQDSKYSDAAPQETGTVLTGRVTTSLLKKAVLHGINTSARPIPGALPSKVGGLAGRSADS